MHITRAKDDCSCYLADPVLQTGLCVRASYIGMKLPCLHWSTARGSGGGFLACILPAGLSTSPDSELAPRYRVHADKMLQFKTWHKSAINAWTAAGFFPLCRIWKKKKKREIFSPVRLNNHHGFKVLICWHAGCWLISLRV